MDIDHSQTEGSTGADCDNDLLSQFSCMVTTDKDELVDQLQKISGNALNEPTARYFLDMNNWNLQAAVCAYFDVLTPKKLPEMILLPDPVPNEVESIEPSTSFTKTWDVYNASNEDWPTGCYLRRSQGDPMGVDDSISIPSLKGGSKMTIQVEMKSPEKPGMYQGKWRMCTNVGMYFGDPLWVIISVVEEGTIELTQQLSHLSDLGSTIGNVTNVTNPFIHSRTSGNFQDGSAANQDHNMC